MLENQTNPTRVFLTGGTGFVGRSVLRELLARDVAVNALVQSKPLAHNDPRIKSITGGLFEAQAVADGMTGCDAVIHLVGIIREKKDATFHHIHVDGTRAVLDAAGRAGITRYIHMSALGSRPTAVSNYHKTKFDAEEYVRRSGLDHTIFRPSLIHGQGGEFMQMEAAWARGRSLPFLFMPYFGSGKLGLKGGGQLQPIFVGDVARAFVDALTKPQTINQTYVLGGQEKMSWPEMHKIASEIIVGKRRRTAPIPAWYGKVLTSVVPSALLPFNRDQIIMSQENNTCDLSKFIADFGWEPRGFAEALKTYSPGL